MFLVPIYVGEISSARNRGSLSNFIHIFVNLGIIFVYTLGYFVDHKTLNIIYGSIPLLYGIAFQPLNESPPYLVSKGKHNKAEKSLFSLRENEKLFEEELVELKKGMNLEVKEKKSFRDLMEVKAVRRAMIIMCFQFFFFQMSGINAVNFYAQSILKEAGMELFHPGISSIIYVIFLTISSLITTVVARYFDRRFMLCFFGFFNATCLLIIGAYYNAKKFELNVEGFQWIPLVALSVNALVCSLGIAFVTYALLGELFTLESKKIIAPITQIVSHFLTFVIVLAFPAFVEIIGTGNIFFIFAILTYLDVIFAYFFIPETRGKSIQEIQSHCS